MTRIKKKKKKMPVPHALRRVTHFKFMLKIIPLLWDIPNFENVVYEFI